MVGEFPKRYIFTAAQASYKVKRYKDGTEERFTRGVPAVLNKHLYENLKRFAEEKEAELRVLPIKGSYIGEDVFHESISEIEELEGWKRYYERLNSNATLTDIRVPPQNVDPATSRKSLTARYRATLFFPHSKQRICPVPSSPSELPRFIVTTGCVTSPNYNTDNDRGDQAMRDHKLGAAYIEVLDENIYLFRHLSAGLDGKFVDLGVQYEKGAKSKRVTTDALVLGDYHWGEHDPATMQANYEMIEFFSPKKIVLHDFFSGDSVSHWDLDRPLHKTKKFLEGKLSLEDELRSLYQEMVHVSKLAKKGEFYVVHSNHDDFLTTYLESGAWRTQDLWNAEICHSLTGRILKNATPSSMYLKEALSMFGEIPRNFTFLGLNDKLSVQGFRLSTHGHKGVNGSKGMSIKKVDETIGKGVIAHKHAPEQFRESKVVGTSSRPDLHYAEGSLSASMGANWVVYSNGRDQLLPIINGMWKSE